jgi:hypothetical protein
MIQKQIVYLPVEITEEFWRKYDSGEEKPEYEIIDADTGERIDEWVNQQEGYFFTPEQLNEYTANVIKQALETAAEKADITYTQETHPFSEEDVRWIFAKAVQLAPSTESHTRMISDEQYRNHVLDSLYSNVMKLWKEQQPKIIYYE